MLAAHRHAISRTTHLFIIATHLRQPQLDIFPLAAMFYANLLSTHDRPLQRHRHHKLLFFSVWNLIVGLVLARKCISQCKICPIALHLNPGNVPLPFRCSNAIDKRDTRFLVSHLKIARQSIPHNLKTMQWIKMGWPIENGQEIRMRHSEIHWPNWEKQSFCGQRRRYRGMRYVREFPENCRKYDENHWSDAVTSSRWCK